MFYDLKKFLSQSATIILVSLLCGILFNVLDSEGVPLIYRKITIQPGAILSPKQARYLFKTKKALFIDARPEKEFRQNHIKGALNLSYQGSRSYKLKILDRIPKESTLVVYCGSIRCTLSERLGRQLLQLGYTRVYIFEKGLEAWSSLGLPVEKH